MKTLTWLIRNVIIHDRQLARPFVIIRLQTHIHCSGRKIKKKKQNQIKNAVFILRSLNLHSLYKLFIYFLIIFVMLVKKKFGIIVDVYFFLILYARVKPPCSTGEPGRVLRSRRLVSTVTVRWTSLVFKARDLQARS